MEPIHVRFSGEAELADLQHCIRQLSLEEVVEVLHSAGVEEQTLEQNHLVEETAERQQQPQPCTVDSIGHMLHSHHKLRTDLDLQLHHSIGRIGQRSRLQLAGYLRQVDLKELLGSRLHQGLQMRESCRSHHNHQIHKNLTDQGHDHRSHARHHSQCFEPHNHAVEVVDS